MSDSYSIRGKRKRVKSREEIMAEIAKERKKPLEPPTITQYRKQLRFPTPPPEEHQDSDDVYS